MSDRLWWRDGVIYQIYPRSFMDSNGDGVGDLEGIRQRLDHLAWLGVEGIWLSPCFPSPMADFGYDVADYCDIDPLFGSLADLDRLLEEAHARALRLPGGPRPAARGGPRAGAPDPPGLGPESHLRPAPLVPRLPLEPCVDREGRLLLAVHPEVNTGVIDEGVPNQTIAEVTSTLLAGEGDRSRQRGGAHRAARQALPADTPLSRLGGEPRRSLGSVS
jgi:hypothetical protein